MASRRLQKRLEVEAAEKQGKTTRAAKKRPAKKATTARKRKAKAPERKRLLWGVFSGTLKEEGRYAYDERDKAEERLAQLRARSKKLFFIQPIKEVLSESTPAADEVIPPEDELEDEVVATSEDDDDEGEDDEEEEDAGEEEE